MLAEAEITKFQELYLLHYGVLLSRDLATQYGLEFIGLVEAVIKISDKK